VSDANADLLQRLLDSYSEPHRSYHTLQHLQECFTQLDSMRASAERPAEIELALWFHDAIYGTRSRDNEERSAQWAHESALAGGTSVDVADRIRDLILLTKHNAVPRGRDGEILIDVDLGILSAEPARFDEYERQVREEYRWVIGPLYRRERRRILQEFASRPVIYFTSQFRASRERQARDNIARSLARL